MNTGTIMLGGPMATGGGIVFTAAAMDNYLREFDSETDKEIWKYPASGGRAGCSDDVQHRRKAVPGDCGRGPWQARNKARRLRHGLHTALENWENE
jgi:quinoprotein glucose dehydrogenase